MIRSIPKYFILALIFSQAYIVVSQCNPSNLLINSGFESDYTVWNTRMANNGQALFTISNNAVEGAKSAHVEVQQQGTNFWDIQIKQENLMLSSGTEYKLVFSAKTETGSSAMRFGGNQHNDNATVFNGTVMLTNNWQVYELIFSPSSSEEIFIFFNYGDILGAFYLDDVRLAEYCPTSNTEGSFCKTINSPGINGSEGPIWEDAIPHSISNIQEGSVVDAADLSGYYKMIWDSEKLFLVINVTDDMKVQDSDLNNLFYDDGIEVFIDVNNDKQSTFDSDDHHFLFRWNDPVIHHISENVQDPIGVEAAFLNQASGYIYEISIPWVLLGTVDQGQSVGIDIHLNDDDNGGNTREAHMAWFSSDISSIGNPSLWGEGRLELIPCGKVYPEYEPIICGSLPAVVHDCSGLIVSHKGSLWTHNDKQGDNPPNDSIL